MLTEKKSLEEPGVWGVVGRALALRWRLLGLHPVSAVSSLCYLGRGFLHFLQGVFSCEIMQLTQQRSSGSSLVLTFLEGAARVAFSIRAFPRLSWPYTVVCFFSYKCIQTQDLSVTRMPKVAFFTALG